ncbi:hypothetical protein AaE_007778 [Aphanomyces astaci]|uniref:Protein kinase domain-containing protein n=1 Tax=Aphanomyces astaci TaxID=112090 RepID=A0A6A5ACR4_APHAT|nr:hypothetical protein AaE_007778 [Aphanomyces astaci]
MAPSSLSSALGLIHGVTLMENRFLYRRDLGSGTSSIVILALDTFTKKNVAIKIWNESLSASGEREVDILELVSTHGPRLGLPIVQLVGAFYYHERLCIVMELLDAPIHLHSTKDMPDGRYLPAAEMALDADIDCISRPQMSLHKLRLMAFHTCAALAFVHNAGIIHGDLKPDNILSDNSVVDGGVKLVDFGNSIYLDEATNQISAHGFDVQAMLYRAPEVAIGSSLSTAADMWSLGCIVLEGLIGQPVFAARSRAHLLTQIDQVVPLTLASGMFHREYMAFRRQVEVKPISLDAILKRFRVAHADVTSFLHTFDIDVHPAPSRTIHWVFKGASPSILASCQSRELLTPRDSAQPHPALDAPTTFQAKATVAQDAHRGQAPTTTTPHSRHQNDQQLVHDYLLDGADTAAWLKCRCATLVAASLSRSARSAASLQMAWIIAPVTVASSCIEAETAAKSTSVASGIAFVYWRKMASLSAGDGYPTSSIWSMRPGRTRAYTSITHRQGQRTNSKGYRVQRVGAIVS